MLLNLGDNKITVPLPKNQLFKDNNGKVHMSLTENTSHKGDNIQYKFHTDSSKPDESLSLNKGKPIDDYAKHNNKNPSIQQGNIIKYGDGYYVALQEIKNNTDLNTIKNGFTLIEVIVTMVILGILITGSVMSLMAWQRHSIYKKNNKYAQTLFLAAQSALASMEAGGGLDSLEQYVKGSSDNEYCGKAENYTPSRSLYYMDIHMNEEDTHLQSNPLYQLLKNYVYDEQIFNAAIRLEFDPEDGSVYAVSYSERVKCFDYSDSDGTDSKSMGITKDVRENDVQLLLPDLL